MSAAHFMAPDVSGDRITLTGEEAAHAARALRMADGERITVTDGAGTIVTGTVAGPPSADAVHVEVAERRQVPAPMPRLVVHPAVPKKGKLDLVIEKLTELGVAGIEPWIAQRSIARWDASKRRRQAERGRLIARAAVKQARLAWLPSIGETAEEPPTVAPAIVCHEGAERGLIEALPAAAPPELHVILGPEGGLTEGEVGRFVRSGAEIVSLGDPIFRAETAALVASVLVMGRFHVLG